MAMVILKWKTSISGILKMYTYVQNLGFNKSNKSQNLRNWTIYTFLQNLRSNKKNIMKKVQCIIIKLWSYIFLNCEEFIIHWVTDSRFFMEVDLDCPQGSLQKIGTP